MCHNTGMKEPAILYLIVGLPGAGKTTKARQLEVEASTLRFTPDEWMKTLFGRNDQATRDILEGRLIWIALRALQLHTNVILDFGFWSKDERASLRWFANQLGVKSQVNHNLAIYPYCGSETGFRLRFFRLNSGKPIHCRNMDHKFESLPEYPP